MSFLYPLFLLAGLALAIPVLIHLFNLRRYKTVYFPHTRFLKNIQLHSRRQSQVRYKWLLALRLLFLTALILAFAQPFFMGKKQKAAGSRLQVLYIDNSGSMSVKKGARSLLELARDAAQRQVRQSPAGTKFILLTNDKPSSYQPLPADKILAELNSLDISANNKTAEQVFATVQNLVQAEGMPEADLYYYSDFQKNIFPARPDKKLTKQVVFHGVPVQGSAAQNIYVDTAYLTMPVLQAGQTNQLVVHTRAIGKLPAETPVLQLSVNGQVKSAASLQFNEQNESFDTLSFTVNNAGWQQVTLSLNDAAVRFDDSFYISARSTPGLSVLVLNESQPNAYIQAAFRSYSGFRLDQNELSSSNAPLKNYNLVILNGITRLDAVTGQKLNEALQQGQTICIFPGRTNNIAALNEGLKAMGDITIAGVDTAAQTISSLQQGSDIVKDIFERVPDNIQLPVANWHYIIKAGLSANQQSVMSFRSGDPFLARYTPSKGQLYISAATVDLQSGNFASSYFFVPFLYQMAVKSQSSDIYALTSGKQQTAWLQLGNAGERNMVHLYRDGLDIIPPQRPAGAGLEVFVDQAVQSPGFYTLAGREGDTTTVALNRDRSESALETWSISDLKSQWKGDGFDWMNSTEAGTVSASGFGSFPLWKVCVILALIMLAAETLLLAPLSRPKGSLIEADNSI